MNAVSSPMTWGFPAITAFLGFMWALHRKLAEAYPAMIDTWYSDVNEQRTAELPMIFKGVGLVCHSCEPKTSTADFTKVFHLTRNPLGKDGQTKSIVQEGRVHLDLTLVFSVAGRVVTQPPRRGRLSQGRYPRLLNPCALLAVV